MKNRSKYVIGASVAAAVAAGIVGFLTQTARGKKLAKKGKEYASDIASQVAHRAERVKGISQKAYNSIVDEVVAQYQQQKKLNVDAGKDLATQLKKEWNAVKRELKKK
jgi:hypothetical protein